jgi:hypothetical protein
MQARLEIIDFGISASGEYINGPDFRFWQLQRKLRVAVPPGRVQFQPPAVRPEIQIPGISGGEVPLQYNLVTVDPLDGEFTLVCPDTDCIKSGYRPGLFYLCHVLPL